MVKNLHLLLLLIAVVSLGRTIVNEHAFRGTDKQSNLATANLTSSTPRDWYILWNLPGQSLAIPPIGIWNSGRSPWMPEDDPAVNSALFFALQNGNFLSFQVDPRTTPVPYHNIRLLSTAAYCGYLNRLWIASVDGVWLWNLAIAPNPNTWQPAAAPPALYGVVQQIVPVDTDNGNFVIMCTNKGQTLWFNAQTLIMDRLLSNVGRAIDCAHSRFISTISQDANGIITNSDYIISAWPIGLYIIQWMILDPHFPPINIDQPYENMTALVVHRPGNRRGVWLIKGFAQQLTPTPMGKITIHDLTGALIKSYDYPFAPVSKIVLGQEADGTDSIISGHANGNIWKVLMKADGTFIGPICITPHTVSLANPVTALAFNYLLNNDDNQGDVYALPAIIAGYRDGTVNMLLSNSTRWILLASPVLFNVNFYFYAGVSMFRFQPRMSGQFPYQNTNNLIVGFSNATIAILQPPNDYLNGNFLLETPSLRYQITKRWLINNPSGLKLHEAIKYQLIHYGDSHPTLTSILFYKPLAEEPNLPLETLQSTALLRRHGLRDISLSSQVSWNFLCAQIVLTNVVTLQLADSTGTKTLALMVSGYLKNSQFERHDIAMVEVVFPDSTSLEVAYDVLVSGYTYQSVTYSWTSTTVFTTTH